MAEATDTKWEGKVSAKVKGTPEQVWPFVEDFCNLHKWLPAIGTCYKVEGEEGKPGPGLIRYCGVVQSEDWTHEKLLSIDPIQRSISYEVVKSNVGFHSYVAVWKVIPVEGGGEYGCEVEWSFVAGPIDGWKFEDFMGFLELGIQGVAERMNKALESTN